MTPPVAALVRQQLPEILGTVESLGKLQSIRFEHGSADQRDAYLVTFGHGKVDWTIGELIQDGKAQARGYRVL